MATDTEIQSVDPFLHLRDKLYAYRNPSPSTAATRFYLRGDEVWTVTPRGRQRAVHYLSGAELQRDIERRILVEAEAE